MERALSNITIIGAGNVAYHLAKAFFLQNIKINCVCSRRIENAKELADLVGAEAHHLMKNYNGWGEEDLVILAVSDDAIDKVVQTNLLKNSVVVHTSGSYDSVKMKSYVKSYGALYPFQTFKKYNTLDIREVPFFIESNEQEIEEELVKLAKLISNNVNTLSSEGRRKLHISGVFINNFMYYILDKMKRFCAENDINPESLYPIVSKTMDNALFQEDDLQTGPAKRGDLSTIQEHLNILQEDKELKYIYKSISKVIYAEEYGKEIEL